MLRPPQAKENYCWGLHSNLQRIHCALEWAPALGLLLPVLGHLVLDTLTPLFRFLHMEGSNSTFCASHMDTSSKRGSQSKYEFWGKKMKSKRTIQKVPPPTDVRHFNCALINKKPTLRVSCLEICVTVLCHWFSAAKC
jgi:hypothetical protein